MGGVQSGTHSLGDALWVQERQKQKCYRDGIGRYDTGSNGHGPSPQSLCSTQDRRKLLKRTRSLAVISEDEGSRAPSRGHIAETSSASSTELRLGYDTSSLQHQRRHQLIPRAKLIDRSTLKDRLSKSQQHLSESYYERLQDFGPSHRACQSRSVCGLYSLTPGLNTHVEPLGVGPGYQRRASSGARHHPNEPYDRLNILNWPENSPRRYRSVQDLNSVGNNFVDFVDDSGWPIEENRSVDCIYTQVKRKRKEHRSLDSILFEDDSDELEYFDILNLLPLSNVRLEINESDSTTTRSRTLPERGAKELFNRDSSSKSNPGIISFSAKDHHNWGFEKCSKHHHQQQHRSTNGGVRITEIDDTKNSPIGCDDNFIAFDSPAGESTTSFPELARERQIKSESGTPPAIGDTGNHLLDSAKTDVQQIKPTVETCHSKQHKDKKKNIEGILKETSAGQSALLAENQKNCLKNQTEDSKSLWISDNEEQQQQQSPNDADMSRRPQVLKVIDNDVTKPKTYKKSVTIDLQNITTQEAKENVCQNNDHNYQQTYRISSNKPDLINDHVYDVDQDKEMDEMEDKEAKERLSVENARSFFEKKSADQDPLTNRNGSSASCDARFVERIVKETSGKACHAVKGSLGYEARSESSDLGFGSEIGSDVRRLSVDENTNEERTNNNKKRNHVEEKNRNNSSNNGNYSNLTRSRSCMDSIEQLQDSDEPEFDHVRYKIVKSNMFGKNIFNNGKKDVTYDGLMQYLREYSFQDLLMDNNVVIIEPVRAEVERKPSFNDPKLRTSSSFRISSTSLKPVKDSDSNGLEKSAKPENNSKKPPRQSSLRKHFFYQPIRVNRELNDDELPDPDTVRNVRKMFEETLKQKLTGTELKRGDITRKSVSMKDLRMLDSSAFDCGPTKATEESTRSRCSSRAKDLTKMFENIERRKLSTTPPPPATVNGGGKEEAPEGNPRNESKTRIMAQAFEARSGQTSPSDSNSSKNNHRTNNKYNQRHLHNWDSGSVSSGVSSDYPDTDAGSAPHCTSSEDEELYCHDDDGVDERYEGHYVSQDVLKKIREYGTSVTYYGGKVVNTCNGPLICPMVCKKSKGKGKALDYIKFRLVKSNSCDSRLELTGRLIETRNKCNLGKIGTRDHDLRQLTIDETPSIEITSIEPDNNSADKTRTDVKIIETKEEKREPPVVIGLEPKKEENKTFKADFKLGKLDDGAATLNRFAPSSALTRWQINENTWKRNSDFGKMEFEEFEVLEVDSLNEVGT